ncbi:helix-turn-helix transcriptional regulator [uncultured Clostridium sp.]|jgi:transcriptional regulator with XRE-family HTH domain|uniref:helix-turn-helix domain-containing protein n=1 Tax=uncultured Clostridium sp. TaxID=59620 RepID=UPI0025F297F5|nr:helix-turn-helix transcriptional regulator [uncultured Clostridium sp.]
MITNKIGLTRSLRLLIKNKRNEKKITGAELSNVINQKASYISALENGRIKSLSSENLITLIKFLFDCDSMEAQAIIEKNLQSSNKIDTVLKKELGLDSKNSISNLKSPNKIETYDTIEDPTAQITLDELVDNIKSGFEIVYKKRPDFTISTLKRFVLSLHYDIAFMMVILRTPYFVLEGLDHDERQKFLNELSDIFKKYALLSKAHMDEQKTDETPETNDDEEAQVFNTDPTNPKNIKLKSTESNISNNDASSPESNSGSDTGLQHEDNKDR